MKKLMPLAASIALILVASLFASAGTLTLFHDTETSKRNIFTAGTLDLELDLDGTWYNGENMVIFDEGDVKPGDWGEATISVHVYDNDAWLWIHLDVTEKEHGMNEPERKADKTPGEGDLAENLLVRIWCDDGDNIWQLEEPIIFEGPASDIPACYWIGPEELTACTTYYIGISWMVPPEVGNEIQSDSLRIDATFYAEQTKNNPSPTPPT